MKNYAHADETDRELMAVMRRRVGEDLLRIDIAEDARDADACRSESAPFTTLMPTLDRYRQEGFHHRLAEVGQRVLSQLRHDDDPGLWWWFSHRTAGALAALGHEMAARGLYDEGRRVSVDPGNRATAAYATAMLLVRHHDHARRDPAEAMAWINEAVTITSLLPDLRQRAFHFSFDLNGKALIELRLGRPTRALALVEQAIEVAADGLKDQHVIHQLILRANRGRLMQRLGRLDEALADFNHIVQADPGYPDYHLERAALLRRMGRPHDALADLDTAIALGLPSPQAAYNRADLLLTIGDDGRAAADLDYAIELDPEFTATYTNRAALRIRTGDLEGAAEDIALADREAPTLCVLAQLELAHGRPAQARQITNEILASDRHNATAWALDAEAAFATDDFDRAIDSLSRSIAIEPTIPTLWNRATVLQMAGRLQEAALDLEHAITLDPANAELIAAHKDMRAAAASSTGSHRPLPPLSEPAAM
ncbi:tetratricopeptide repeat protein [Nonomuraea sp. NPDC004702]